VKTEVRNIVCLMGVTLLCASTSVAAQQVRQGRVLVPGQTGQEQAILTDKPMGRISTRIGNRVQSRVNSRIGRGDPSQTGVLSSFQQAQDRVGRAGRR